MKALRAVNNYLASASLTLAMLIIFIMVAALFLSATTRFITGTGFAWFIELPPVLVSWLVFPMLGPLLKTGNHIEVDFVSTIISARKIKYIKLGMLYDTETMKTVLSSLQNFSNLKIISDPVMISKSGDSLLKDSSIKFYIKKLERT